MHDVTTIRRGLASLALAATALLATVVPLGTATAAPQPQAHEDRTFTIAVMPDTQQEASAGDSRMSNRTRWLADNADALNLKFVLHTGDVTNWGWVVPRQLQVASDSMTSLERAGIPYALALGNHDTRAVGSDGRPGSRGYGGSAYVNNPECLERFSRQQCETNYLLRQTQEFNAYFTADRYTHVAGAFEAGKVDNIYSTFSAGGRQWMVLTLEFTPRAEVVEWARHVVASHPDHTVIVQTHYYLDPGGSISTSNDTYGDKSPMYLYDRLIKVYPNISMVFSGHIGDAEYREDIGVHGNKIASFLLNGHQSNGNAVRLVQIDTTSGMVDGRVYAPNTGTTISRYNTLTGGLFGTTYQQPSLKQVRESVGASFTDCTNCDTTTGPTPRRLILASESPAIPTGVNHGSTD